MSKRIVSLLAAVLMVAFPSLSFADPGVGAWAISGSELLYIFTGDVNSTVRILRGGPHTICFDPADDSDGADTAEVQIRRVVAAEDDNGSIILSDSAGAAITLTGAVGASCIYEVPAGRYWVDVTTPPGSETATVSIREG